MEVQRAESNENFDDGNRDDHSANNLDDARQDQDRDQDKEARDQEARLLRRLQIMMNMVMSVLSQDPGLTLEEASEMAAGARRAALAMFPDKALAYDLIYRPRLQRLMNERFRLQ